MVLSTAGIQARVQMGVKPEEGPLSRSNLRQCTSHNLLH